MIELHTGTYADSHGPARTRELERLRAAARQAAALGLTAALPAMAIDLPQTCNPWLRSPEIVELNIGYSHHRPRAVHRACRGGARDEGTDATPRADELPVFDIETIPGRGTMVVARCTCPDLPDAEVASAMFALRRARSGNDFLPLPQHRIVAISCALRRADSLKVWSLGDEGSSERELLERFFEGIERFSPDLVSWNGGGLRPARDALPMPGERRARTALTGRNGEEDSAFRYNNYLSRYHWRHLGPDGRAGRLPAARQRRALTDVAVMLGFPRQARLLRCTGLGCLEGRRPSSASGVTARPMCSTPNLIFLAFERMRGRLEPVSYEAENRRVRELLAASSEPQFPRVPQAMARARAVTAEAATGRVDALNHEGWGVVRAGPTGGKTTFVAGALPGRARGVSRAQARTQPRRGAAAAGAGAIAGAHRAALCALRHLRGAAPCSTLRPRRSCS